MMNVQIKSDQSILKIHGMVVQISAANNYILCYLHGVLIL